MTQTFDATQIVPGDGAIFVLKSHVPLSLEHCARLKRDWAEAFTKAGYSKAPVCLVLDVDFDLLVVTDAELRSVGLVRMEPPAPAVKPSGNMTYTVQKGAGPKLHSYDVSTGITGDGRDTTVSAND